MARALKIAVGGRHRGMRHASPRELRACEDAYPELESYLPGGLLRLSPEGRIRHATARLATMLGYEDPRLLIGLDVADLCVDAGDAVRLRERLESESIVSGFALQMYRADGRTLRVRFDGKAFRGPAGGVRHYEGLIQEITPTFPATPDISASGVEPLPADSRGDGGRSGAPGRGVVLIVENDPASRDDLRRVLNGSYDVLTAATPLEAHATLAARATEIVIVLMDVALNRSADGLRLWTRLRERPAWQHISIIATTTRPLSEDEERSLVDSCNGYLVKPSRRSDGLAAVDVPFRPHKGPPPVWKEWSRWGHRLLHHALHA